MASFTGDQVVLVGGLLPEVSEENLVQFFATVGEVTRVKFGKDSLTGSLTGNAYCVFESPAQAEKALALNNTKILDNQISVKEVPPSALTLTVETSTPTSESKPTIVVQNQLRISCFSGESKPKGGEVGFEAWKYEVTCLAKDEACSSEILARLVRRSLRGEAAQIILSLGPEATTPEIVTKLEGFYGTLESGAVLLQQLYCSRQFVGEPVAAYSARLQLLIDRAEKRGGVPPGSKDETLRTVFWKGLMDEQVKQAIRHRYEQTKSFDELVRIARQLEQELSEAKDFKTTGPARPNRAQHQPTSAANTSHQEEAQALADLKQRIVQLERASPDNNSYRSPMNPQRMGFRGACYRCGEQGHMARECRIPPQSRGPNRPSRFPFPNPQPPQTQATNNQMPPYQPMRGNNGPLNPQGPPPWGGQWTQNSRT